MVLCSMAQHRDYPLYNLERSIEGLKEKKESLIEGEGGGGFKQLFIHLGHDKLLCLEEGDNNRSFHISGKGGK